MNRLILLIFVVLLSSNHLAAQTDYSNRQQLGQRVAALSKTYPNFVKTQSLAKTIGGSDIWLITIGTGNTQQKPAIAVVGGIEGNHLLGVELAIGFAENLLAGSSKESTRKLLETQTFYVFPNMSPDATEQYFAALQYERHGNARKIDTDRDGKVAEDGYDDLDKDGKITFIRVTDPTGDYILNPDEPRSLIKADKSKEQFGLYRLFTEGIDNDKDGAFNENGDEGIHFNKNSTYNYKNFEPGAGEYAVSEIENRAMFDFLYDAFNVYTVISFGPHNNLSHPVQSPARAGGVSAQAGAAGGRGGMGGGAGMFATGRVSSWSAEDALANGFAAERYKTITETKDAPRTTPGNGNFADWAYYHYGRLSFSTPGWWVPKVAAASAGGERGAAAGRGGATPAGTAGGVDDPVANYLKWADSEGINNTFTPWKAIEHPDFPGQQVEVGGIHPFVLHNPPYRLVSDIVSKHTDFVASVAEMAPFIKLIDVKTEKIDNGLTRVSLKVFNTGLLPTLSQVGARSQFSKLINVKLNTVGNQKVVSGRKMQTLSSIPGKEYVELSWLVQGTGKLQIEAGSPNTGSDNVEVSL